MTAPLPDQHTRNLAAVSTAMNGHKFMGSGITHGGRHVHHYQTPSHDVLVAHIGNEMTTYSKPRAPWGQSNATADNCLAHLRKV